MGQHEKIWHHRNCNRLVRKLAIRSKSRPFDEKFVIISGWTENRCLLNRILNSSPIVEKRPTSCNAIIKAAARLHVAINFPQRFSLESLVSTSTVAIRKRHCVTRIWILPVVVVTCQTHRRVVRFRHSVNCSWLTEFSRLNFDSIVTDLLIAFLLFLLVLRLWLIST